MAQDYWWVTRPKRKLNAIPEELAAFCSVALGRRWTNNRAAHIAFEEELEKTGTKRIGERRDATGSGGRTHAVMLYSLGLWFEYNGRVFLTLAGDSIMNGKSPISVLKKQVLNFQYPSAYSDSVKVSSRFRIRPFRFLLRLLSDERLSYLQQEEIALIVAIRAENESDTCYESVVKDILRFRSYGSEMFPEDYFLKHDASKNNLMDMANTIMNWLDYTQLVYREKKVISLDSSKLKEVESILNDSAPMIKYPVNADIFQRKYGVDPWHQKDTRNLLLTETITTEMIERDRILRKFFEFAALNPVSEINENVIGYICESAGTDYKFAEIVLSERYPNGSFDAFLSNYRSMAFKGTEESREFEIATANLFHEVFGYQTVHLGQSGSKSTPDVLICSADGYQAIIDNKAYSAYSISGDHHNRMVHNYIERINNYSSFTEPLSFFTYISGGFSKTFDKQVEKVASESGIRGSGISASNIIAMVERHQECPYTQKKLREMFSLNRQIMLTDIR